MQTTHQCAEVIRSSLHSWEATTRERDTTPSFGSLVVIPTETVNLFGIVHQIVTGPTDTIHTPLALGKTPADLERDYPHINLFLTTTISCITLCYEERDTVWYQWPAVPARIHAFVYEATDAHYAKIFSNEGSIRMLFSHASRILSLDELILAVITRLSERHLFTNECLDRFIEQIAFLTGSDYRKLKLFLQRIETRLEQSYQR